ncbi:MAG: putative cytokinetic ring protein SteA [Bacillota bacterium]
MGIRGTARVGKATKILVRRLQPGEIAVIDHRELDDVAAHALLEAKVKAVINASPSISDKYPNRGPHTLVSSGVVLVDNVGGEIMDLVKDGQTIEISGGRVLSGKKVIAAGEALTVEEVRDRMDRLKENMKEVLCDFVSNTLEYARNEIGLISGAYKLPELKTPVQDRHVLIVVRGQNYKEDLSVIKSYVEEMRPLLVGVDGGADALLESGYRPDLIVGDMDSVSDTALFCGAELVTHAYSDGNSPGLERVKKLGLESAVFAAPGTSEDIAMLLTYEMGAELIVLVGSHSNIHDFLEKGRKGMASTFLVRLKVGSVLVDAKGVSRLYKSRVKARHLAQIVLAALIPAALVAVLSPPIRQILKLLYLRCKVLFGL